MLCLPQMNGNEMIHFKTKVLIVKDIAQSFIIGIDLLEQYGANISLIRHRVTFINKRKYSHHKMYYGQQMEPTC